VPVGEKAGLIVREMPRAPEEVPLFKAVAGFVKRRFGIDIPAREWALADVPKHLRLRVAVVDPSTGRVIDAGRDVELLRKKIGAADLAPSKVESPAWQEARRAWEKSGLSGWTFGDLPETIAVGTSLTAYPALKIGDTIPISDFRAPEKTITADSLRRADKRGDRRYPSLPDPCRGRGLAQTGRPLAPDAQVREGAGLRPPLSQDPGRADRAALYFGGREAVEGHRRGPAREAFERDIRAEAAYRAYETEVGRTLFENGTP
jgi:hypothetical protein